MAQPPWCWVLLQGRYLLPAHRLPVPAHSDGKRLAPAVLYSARSFRCNRWPALHSLHTRAAVHVCLKFICFALANCRRTSWVAARAWRGSTAPSSAVAWTR